MIDPFLAAFAAIASVLFVTELTDKDALLILTLATKTRAPIVFLAGSTAFVLTTTLFVTLGTIAISFVPIFWIKLAGGGFMIAYGLWEARGLVGQGMVKHKERKLETASTGLKVFLGMVVPLVLLDIAGDATEILTIILVAQYSDPLLVFSATCTGLIAATAMETLLGNRLGRMLTPKRIRYVSMVVFLFIGTYIIAISII